MSPVPVICFIEKEVIKNAGSVATSPQDQIAIMQNTIFDYTMVSLEIATDADMRIGSLATMFLSVATSPVDYQAELVLTILTSLDPSIDYFRMKSCMQTDSSLYRYITSIMF